MRRIRRLAPRALVLAAVLAACQAGTGQLPPERERRIAQGGVVRRAENQTFRYTHDAGGRDAGWEERRASIIVTHSSLLIH
jgi:hypothetical protein